MKLRALIFAIAAASAFPQNEPEIVSHQSPATFSSRVNLVSVPVVIRDQTGKAVGGLRQEDFQLSDKGHSQVITKFAVETSAEAAVNAAHPPRPAQPADAAKEAHPQPQLPERYIAYFFDDVNLKPGDLLNARQAANRQMDKTLDAGSRAGIFTTGGRTTQDFTSDPAKLHAAVNRIQPWESAKPDKVQDCWYMSYYVADQLINKTFALRPGGAMNANDPLMAAVAADNVQRCGRPPGNALGLKLWEVAQQALNFGKYETITGFYTLLGLIKSMSALPGSRTIVMASPGFIVVDEQRFNENDVFDAAIRANVVINTLDVRGLYTPPGFEASDRGNGTSIAGGILLQAENDAASLSSDILAEFASATGGTFFHNDNGLAEGLQQLAARPEYVYVLGYSPDNLKYDGSYHRLKVTVRNGAKLTIEARRGYWAPNHAIDAAQQAREAIEDAVFSREEMLDIPVKLHTEFFKQSEAKAELTVDTHVDMQSVQFKKADDRNRDSVIVVTGLFDENGRYVKGTERTFDMKLRDQTLESARTSGLNVKESFDVPPGRYVVRVVVRDAEGRSMAAQSAGVEIP